MCGDLYGPAFSGCDCVDDLGLFMLEGLFVLACTCCLPCLGCLFWDFVVLWFYGLLLVLGLWFSLVAMCGGVVGVVDLLPIFSWMIVIPMHLL